MDPTLPLLGALVPFLVRELSSHKPKKKQQKNFLLTQYHFWKKMKVKESRTEFLLAKGILDR